MIKTIHPPKHEASKKPEPTAKQHVFGKFAEPPNKEPVKAAPPPPPLPQPLPPVPPVPVAPKAPPDVPPGQVDKINAIIEECAKIVESDPLASISARPWHIASRIRALKK